jgi:hypothetical protein
MMVERTLQVDSDPQTEKSNRIYSPGVFESRVMVSSGQVLCIFIIVQSSSIHPVISPIRCRDEYD